MIFDILDSYKTRVNSKVNNNTNSLRTEKDFQESEEDKSSILKEALNRLNQEKETKNQVDNNIVK